MTISWLAEKKATATAAAATVSGASVGSVMPMMRMATARHAWSSSRQPPRAARAPRPPRARGRSQRRIGHAHDEDGHRQTRLEQQQPAAPAAEPGAENRQ